MTHPEDRDGSTTPPTDGSAGTSPSPDSDLSDGPNRSGGADDDWVARLLARTPVEPIPGDVTARLDGVLADLVAARRDADSAAAPSLEPESDPGAGPVPRTPDVPSSEARRSRSVPRVVRGLLATAAVLVLLVGGAYMTTHLAPPGGFGGGNTSSADSAAGSEAAPRSTGSAAAPFADGSLEAVPRLTSAAFAEQMQVLLDGAPVEDLGREPLSAQKSTPDRARASAACSPTVAARAQRAVPVILDGRPAVVEIYPVRDGHRLVRAIDCDGTPLANASIPSS